MDGLADGELLLRSRGDSSVFAALYRRHAAVIYRYLSRRVGTAAAEDLLGEVFVAAFCGRLKMDSHASGSILPWLYGIAANVVREHLRRRSRLDLDLGDLTPAVDWAAVDDRLDAQQLRNALRAALSALTAVELELLLLVAWEQLSPTEAAAAVGISPGTARSRLHRARLRAQAHLDMTLQFAKEI